VVLVDMAPLGRSPKSVVATACGAYEGIRKALAALAEARAKRFSASTFSFNTPGGRCEACEGAGFERVEMQFLADVFLPCAECGGDRFRPEVRRAKLRGKTIGQILDLTVDEAASFFAGDDPEIGRRLAPVAAVGLGYLRIGQSVTTLSGGEAQRLKLASAIAGDLGEGGRGSGGSRKAGTLFLFDEPTTGLHLDDVAQLLATLDRLVDAGHTVVAIEHQLDFIAHADFVVDVGPEAGEGGGRIVATGTPEAVAASAGSITGRYLREAGVRCAARPRPAKTLSHMRPGAPYNPPRHELR
jgi:excinuclease ABC subunit A